MPNFYPASRCAASCLEKMKMKTAKTATTARTERFTVTLTANQARRLRFVASEVGQTPEAMIADATVDQICALLMDAEIMSHDTREQERALATRINAHRRAA